MLNNISASIESFLSNMEPLLSFQILNNDAASWLHAAGIALVITVMGKIVQRLVSGWLKRWAERSTTTMDDFIVSTLETIKWEWYVLGIFAATRYLDLSKGVDTAMLWLVTLVLLNRIIRIVSAFINYFANEVYLKKEGVNQGSKGAIKNIVVILQVAVAGVLIVVALDNLGFNVSAVIAGLGVSGIIVGLAVQNIVKDLFSSFCIVFDKPFEIGDFIIVGDYMGVVEHVGIKTTRLTSLGGEQLVFSNSDLTDSRIRNYKRMAKRRVVFGVGVEYGTPEEKLKSIPETVKAIINEIKDATFDRAHFSKFGDSSLDFEVVYYVMSSDYNKYMDVQQKINFEIFARFNKEKINFAFPTRTLHVMEHTVVE
jgi:small-conductance mechanosensitive channel